MTQLFGADGKKLSLNEAAEVTTCPGCGASEKDLVTTTGFGGYWQRNCVRCGREIGKGQGFVTENLS